MFLNVSQHQPSFGRSYIVRAGKNDNMKDIRVGLGLDYQITDTHNKNKIIVTPEDEYAQIKKAAEDIADAKYTVIKNPDLRRYAQSKKRDEIIEKTVKMNAIDVEA